ncbi:hypothetical protein HYY75_03780 [bacterium]|nr:hypothetical protein [bacterium]
MKASFKWDFRVLMAVVFAFFSLAHLTAFCENLPSGQTSTAGSQGKLSERIRYVPFSDFKEVFEKTPKGFLIPKEVYESMKKEKEGFLARKPQSPLPKLDIDFSFGKAQYSGTLHDQVAEFEAEFLFSVPQERWVLLPLPGGDVGLIEVTLDDQQIGVIAQGFSGIQDQEAPKGKVALLQQRFNAVRSKSKTREVHGRTGVSNDFSVAVKGPGNHVLKVRFAVPQVDDPDKNEITFRIPRVPMNTFEVFLDKSGQMGEVDRSEGTVSLDSVGDRTLISGVIGQTDRFTLRWAPKTISYPSQPTETASQAQPILEKTRKEVKPPLVYADSCTLLSFGEGFIRSDIFVQLNITRSPKGIINFMIPKEMKVLDVRSDRLESYEIQDTASGNRIVCRLNAQLQSLVGISISGETKMSDTTEEVAVPVHQVEDVEHDHGYIGVEARTSIEIAKVEESLGNLDVSPIDPSSLPDELSSRATRSILLGFRYLAIPFSKPLKLQITRHKDVSVLTSMIDQVWATTVFGTDETSLTCLDMLVKNNGQQYLKVKVSEGSWIQSAAVEGTPATINLQ